jgi:hypothetical protein
MGFYIRKSLRFGPLRFNLSKSGIGVSAGVKGFRVGTGPRGNYVHAGVGGFYYRSTIPGGGSRQTRPYPAPVPHASTVQDLRDIDSGNVQAMVDADSVGLLTEINNKHKKVRISRVLLVLASIAAAAGAGLASLNAGTLVPPEFEHLIPGAVLLILTIPAAFLDSRRKTTVLFYDLGEPVLSAVEKVHSAFDALSSCAKVWHVGAEGLSADVKYTAGAKMRMECSTISAR